MIGHCYQQERGDGCAVCMRSRSNFGTRCVGFSVTAFLLQSAGCAMAYCIPALRGCQFHADASLLRYICMTFEHCHSCLREKLSNYLPYACLPPLITCAGYIGVTAFAWW